MLESKLSFSCSIFFGTNAEYEKMMQAYSILHKFESDNRRENNDEDDEDAVPRTTWAVEAMGWVETYEKVTGQRLDAYLYPETQALRFSSFAKACCTGDGKRLSRDLNGNFQIYLCDSSRDRIPVLVHIFQPLLKDIFVFKVVGSIVQSLAISHDIVALQKVSRERSSMQGNLNFLIGIEKVC